MDERTQIWSSGGGAQSVAMGALIVLGRLPKPDYSVTVDTNREKSSTWEYLDNVLNPALNIVGVNIERIDSSKYRTVDLYAENGDLLLPIYTNKSGEVGKLPAYCSNEWKKRVVMRWAREQGVQQATCWLGISTNEMQRVRTSDTAWWQLRYPLIFEHRMSRFECLALVESMGWPSPPRTSCWMCPHMTAAEWRELRDKSPEDFSKAVQIDREIRDKDAHAFLHGSCIPLDEVDFSQKQASFFDNGCSSGYCWS